MTARLAVTHLGQTLAMLERGEDLYEPAKLVAAYQACHNRYAARKVELQPIGYAP